MKTRIPFYPALVAGVCALTAFLLLRQVGLDDPFTHALYLVLQFGVLVGLAWWAMLAWRITRDPKDSAYYHNAWFWLAACLAASIMTILIIIQKW